MPYITIRCKKYIAKYLIAKYGGVNSNQIKLPRNNAVRSIVYSCFSKNFYSNTGINNSIYNTPIKIFVNKQIATSLGTNISTEMNTFINSIFSDILKLELFYFMLKSIYLEGNSIKLSAVKYQVVNKLTDDEMPVETIIDIYYKMCKK